LDDREKNQEIKMKYSDIQKLTDAGLITGEQRDKIIAHFNLKEDGGNKFLAIVSMIGAVLITAGIVLLISAHWNEIPRGVKIAAGIALMLGAHGAGWWLREIHGIYRKTGEALHLVGSGLFLANIALLGQIYNLVSRPPNALLLWWLGIAALPWILRSKAQFVLLLAAFGVWFGFEANERGGWLFSGDERQILLYSLLGLFYLGGGYSLRATRFSDFAGAAEKFGLLLFLLFFYPLTWREFSGSWNRPELQSWLFPAFAVAALALVALGARNLRALDRQWRWTWTGAIAGMMVFMASVWLGWWRLDEYTGRQFYHWVGSWSYLAGTIALFIFCLLQIQVGLQERSRSLVNLGIAFIALDIIAAYIGLFGSMARTGVMFLISGIFLIVFGVYLERKRRRLLKQMKSPPERSTP
jgi:uncharacterized membrane protein